MRQFGNYVKTKTGTIALVLFIYILFVVFFGLYHLPMEALVYPILLCTVLSVCFLAADFLREKKKADTLAHMLERTASMIDELPEAKSLSEEQYAQLVQKLVEDIAELRTLENSKYRNMMEYYTVWVHQIKTPIASMRLTLQNEDSALSRKLSSDLFRVEQYVEMVLTFLRLGEDANDYVFKQHTVDELVRSSVRKFASEFIGRKLRLEYTETDAGVVTDEKWFCFVLEQLLSNALKYTREGGIKIYMRGEKELVIEDTGIGIAPEDLPRIFEKGYTGYNGRSDRKATGLGLYLCKRICDNLGIGLSAESEVGKGTRISLHLEQYHLKAE